MIRDPRFRTADDDLAVRLSRYWDALVDEDATPPEPTPDLGDLAVIVRGLADLPRDPAPEEVHARAKARLSANPEWLGLPTIRPHDVSSVPVASNGHTSHEVDAEDAGGERAPTPLRRILPFVELAALAAAILLLLYVAFGRDRHQAVAPVGGTPTVVPAPSPTPGVEIVTLGAVTMPVERLLTRLTAAPTPTPDNPALTPFQSPWWVATGRVVLAPGEGGSLPSISPATGIGFELLLEGSYTVSSGSPLRVVRVSGATEEIPAGTTVTLAPGDSVLHLDVGATQSWRNPGQTEAVLIGAGFYTSNTAIRQRGGTLVGVGGIAGEYWAEMEGNIWIASGIPDGPVLATIRRLTLSPGAALPAMPEVYPTLRWIESGEVGWTAVGAGIATRPPDKPTSRFFGGQRLPWTPSAPGVQIVLSNPSDTDPAVIWEVILTPAGPSPPSPEPS
jgi:hypothetical protein